MFWCFSCSECSGLRTVLLRCSLEMNSKRRSPFSYIPSSFCTSTSYHYILVCDWMSWDCGPFHGQWPWSTGEKSQTMEPGCFFKRCLFLFLTLLSSRWWGCWEYISVYIVLSLMSLVNKCIWFYSLTSHSPVQYSPLSPAFTCSKWSRNSHRIVY